MAQNTIKDLAPKTEGLQDINRNIEMKMEALRPKIGKKRRFVSRQLAVCASHNQGNSIKLYHSISFVTKIN